MNFNASFDMFCKPISMIQTSLSGKKASAWNIGNDKNNQSSPYSKGLFVENEHIHGEADSTHDRCDEGPYPVTQGRVKLYIYLFYLNLQVNFFRPFKYSMTLK